MRTKILTLVFAGLTFVSTAEAALTYDLFFRISGQADNLNGVIDVDTATIQSFTGVSVVLRETVTGGSTSLISASNLNGYLANLSATGSDGSFTSLVVLETGGFAAPANSPTTLNYAALGVPTFNQPGRSANNLGGGVFEVDLGSVTLLAPTTGQTTFTVADGTPADGDFTTFAVGLAGFGLESRAVASGGSFNNNSLTLRVAAIPEPAALGMMALMAGCGFLRRRRLQRS